MFSPLLKSVWGSAVAVTIGVEVMPLPLMSPLVSYSYCIAKTFCFVALGYILPFAFRRFNALNRAMFIAALSSACVETLQGLLHNGHSFHWYELVTKLALLVIGFALALDLRYARRLSMGRIDICSTGEQ